MCLFRLSDWLLCLHLLSVWCPRSPLAMPALAPYWSYEKAQITKCKHVVPLHDTHNALIVDIMDKAKRVLSRSETCTRDCDCICISIPFSGSHLLLQNCFCISQFHGYEAVLNAIYCVLFDVGAAQKNAVNLCSWLMWLSKANMVVFNSYCRQRGRWQERNQATHKLTKADLTIVPLLHMN